jgi:hypothetical protein
MYIKLSTYKKVVVDHRSMSLELQSCVPVAVCMSQAKSFRLLQRVLPTLGKAFPVFSRLNLSQYEIVNTKDA